MRQLAWLPLLFLAVLATGQSMGLALDAPEWKGVQSYPVSGRQTFFKKESLRFGPFHTTEVDRSWTKGYTVTTGLTHGIPTDQFYRKIITTDKSYRKQKLYFTLADQAGHINQIFSLAEARAKDFNIGNSPVSVVNLLLDIAGPGMASTDMSFSQIYEGETGDGWELFIDNEAAQTHPKHYIGYLAKNDSEYYTVTPLSRVKTKKGKTGNMPFGSAGFEIRDRDGRPMAAVSVIDNGIIYLQDMPDRERLLMASACAALLMRPADL